MCSYPRDPKWVSYFFLIIFNCKSELRDWIKRPENLRVFLQVSYLRVLKKNLIKHTNFFLVFLIKLKLFLKT